MRATNGDALRCDLCGKPGGRLVIEPYELELNGRKIKIRMCTNCLESRKDEI